MKQDINKIIFTVICGVLVFFCGALTSRLIFGISRVEPISYTLVRPMVYDAFTGKPIANATVVNTYDGSVYTTDANGSTDWISVYYKENDDTKLNTFIASAEGFKSTAVYAVIETASDPLNGPLIYMFSGSQSETISMVYSPSDEFTQNLADRFLRSNDQND